MAQSECCRSVSCGDRHRHHHHPCIHWRGIDGDCNLGSGGRTEPVRVLSTQPPKQTEPWDTGCQSQQRFLYLENNQLCKQCELPSRTAGKPLRGCALVSFPSPCQSSLGRRSKTGKPQNPLAGEGEALGLFSVVLPQAGSSRKSKIPGEGRAGWRRPGTHAGCPGTHAGCPGTYVGETHAGCQGPLPMPTRDLRWLSRDLRWRPGPPPVPTWTLLNPCFTPCFCREQLCAGAMGWLSP